MQCSNCGTENKDTAKFCKACGAKLLDEQKKVETKQKCKFCGSELDPSMKFCKHCGQPVQSNPKNPNKNKLWWKVIGVILSVFLLIWIFIAVDYIIDGKLLIFSFGEKTTEAMENNKEESIPSLESSEEENVIESEEKTEKESIIESEEETESEKDDKADETEKKEELEISVKESSEEEGSEETMDEVEDTSESTAPVLEQTESLKEKTTVSQLTEPVIQSYPVANSTILENGHTYELYDVSLSWTEAKEYCEKKGGHLVTITSQEEQNVVTSLITAGTKKYYWIGATDEKEEGKWQWVTGEAFTYTNWCQAPLQPDNHSGVGGIEEDYAELLQADGTWMDLQQWGDAEGDSHLSYAGFICEYEL
ncbi:Lectin C-type domain protein [Clostridiales bacterium CHKCI001]|nr:Lectin C-type domain protein [Clostridiales bacterium CHKCI001]